MKFNLQKLIQINKSFPISIILLLVLLDSFLLPLSVYFSFWLRLSEPFRSDYLAASNWLAICSIILGIPLFALTGHYTALTRYVGSFTLYRIGTRNCFLVFLLAGVGIMFQLPMPPRSSWILLWLILTAFLGFARFLLRDLLKSIDNMRFNQYTKVAIYGAGDAGAQLAIALKQGGRHKVVVFIDDDPALWKRNINGIQIQPPHILSEISGVIDQVLLAIPSLNPKSRRRILLHSKNSGIPFLQVPSISDLTSGKSKIDALIPIDIEDLLGRPTVKLDSHLVVQLIRNSVVCVTGAGGSIGSELCRQILSLHPKILVLFDISETSLYTIDQELRCLNSNNTHIEVILGSCSDEILLSNLFLTYKVNLVFHAAAYKHVPLVELNPITGLSNNVLSARAVCSAAMRSSVDRVVLISTDKAVRPTNVMGASKRLSELIFQAFAHLQCHTIFSIVRFGNVLDSSGSVVPLFRRQISSGGPITLTHPNIIRYFMTISEAAQLVLHSTYLATHGDVFLLDMGDPVRIKDLAEQMVLLSGLSVRDSDNPDGDIEIICTGLRPGEKLYEELLIDDNSEITDVPRVYRARENYIFPNDLWPFLQSLEECLVSYDESKALMLLSKLVPEWTSQL